MAGQVLDSQLLPQSQFTKTETGTAASDNHKEIRVTGEEEVVLPHLLHCGCARSIRTG